MNTFKKLLAVIMLVCMLVTLLPAGAAYAAGDQTYTVTFSGPTGTVITIDGVDGKVTLSEDGSTGTGTGNASLTAGSHTYTAVTPSNYLNITSPTEFTVEANNDNQVQLSATPIYNMTFNCSPAELVLTFSPEATPVNGRTYAFDSSKPYTYSASCDGYASVSGKPLNLVSDGSVDVTLTAVYPVSVTGTPGASVSFTDSSNNVVGWVITLDDAGHGTVKLPVADGYKCTATCAHYEDKTSDPFDVTTAGGSVDCTQTAIEYTVTFAPTPNDASITVKKAGTEVDPTSVGSYTYKLTHGDYTYTASKPGYQTITDVPFTVTDTGTKNVTLDQVYKVSFTADGAALPSGSIVKVFDNTGALAATLPSTNNYECFLVNGVYSYTAGHPGYSASGSFSVNSDDKPVNSVSLLPCTIHPDTDADGKCDNCYGTIVASIGDTNYLTLAAAYAAAVDSDTITLKSSPIGADGSITVAKNITLVGSGKTLGAVNVSSECTLKGFTASSITVSAGTPTLGANSDGNKITVNGAIAVTGGSPAFNGVTATSLTASGSAVVTLSDCSITTLTSGSTAMVYVSSGTYGSAGDGKFNISGGTFTSYVDAAKCATAPSQYYAKKNASTGKYDIAALTPDVTAVSNDGEFVKNSGKTLAFTTNIPWEIETHITEVRVGSASLSDAQYTVTSNGAATAPTAVVTLTNAYLQAIATPDTYTLTIVTDDGNATEDFVVTTVAGAANIPDADVESGACSTTQPGATMSAAALGNVAAGLSVTTSGGTVVFDAAAMTDIKTALTNANSSNATLMITKTGSAETGFTFELTLKNAANADVPFTGGTATVTLNVGTVCPATISHTHGATTDVYYKDGATGTVAGSAAKKFTYSSPYATLTVTGFSTISVNVPTVEIGTANQLPNTVAEAATDTAYGPVTFSATPSGTYSWVMNGAPSWLTMTSAGVLSGTVPAGTTAQTWTMNVTATDAANSANNKTETFTLTAVSAATPYEVRLAPGSTGTAGFYTTFADAQTAAAAGDSIVVHSAPAANTDISVSKNVTVYGGGFQFRNVTTTGDCIINNLKATALTAGGAGVARLSGCTVPTVTSTATRLDITSGTYGTINGTGDYEISGGTFTEYIYPVDCLRYQSASRTEQYYSYPSASGVWTVTGPLTPEITAVSNGAYHMRRSTSTIAFTTNIPYTLNADIENIRVGTTSLTNSRYTIYSSNGNDTGYVVIALDDLYLNSLNLGRYRLTVETLEGDAYADFEIGNTVRTGDSANMPLWMGLMGGSVLLLIGAAAYIMLKNKKKKKSFTDKDSTPKT